MSAMPTANWWFEVVQGINDRGVKICGLKICVVEWIMVKNSVELQLFFFLGNCGSSFSTKLKIFSNLFLKWVYEIIRPFFSALELIAEIKFTKVPIL